MKIGLFLNNYHHITGRAFKESQTLSKAGHQITIIAKYSRDLPAVEELGGATVKREIIWPSTKIPLIKQFIYSYRWIKAGLKLDVDVYQVADADTLLEAAFCAWWKKKKLIYDSYELFLDIQSFNGHPWKRRLWHVREWLGVRRADLVIACNQERALVMEKRYPFIKKIAVIENYPSLTVGQSPDFEIDRDRWRNEFNFNSKVVFVFQGFINRGRGLEELLAALPYLKYPERAAFLIIGDGDYREEFERQVKMLGGKNFIFTGRVDYFVLPGYLASADVGLVFYPPTCLNYIYAAPNKPYEYMLNRLCLLSNDIVTLKRIVEAEHNGFYFKSGSPKDLAVQIDRFCEVGSLSRMRDHSYQAALQKYNWEQQEQPLLSLYFDLA